MKHKINTKNNNTKKTIENDENFLDGGFGWIVCVAAGIANLCVLPAVQQFGLIFRDKMINTGFSNSQITTIINTSFCLRFCIGLLNGPLYRKYTNRQIAYASALLVGTALYLTSISNTFIAYLMVYSVILGSSIGMNTAANSIILNTYFKVKRRIATGFMWAITGCGSVIMPHLITYLRDWFGVRGTLMIMSGIALHATVAALLYHPIRWHLPKSNEIESQMAGSTSTVCVVINDDDQINNKINQQQINDRKNLTSSLSLNDEKPVKPLNDDKPPSISDNKTDDNNPKLSLMEKINLYFDLDLLKDFGFLNLLFGIIVGNFSEMNFSVLTPFILGDFGYTNKEIAIFISLLGCIDVVARFSVPLVVKKLSVGNKTLYLFGIVGMAIGRTVLASYHSPMIVYLTVCWIGLCKGLKTVFMNLLVPNYVPLERLPGATGLQLLFGGLFSLVAGPAIGMIRDASNYTIALHCLNIPTVLILVTWTVEALWRSRRKPMTK